MNPFVKMLTVSVFMLPGIMLTGNSIGTANAQCTNPAFTTSGTNGGWSNGGYYVHNNMWNVSNYQVAETLYACAYDNWYVVAKANNNNGDGAVKTYPNVHKDYNNVAISSFNYLTSSFAATSPHVGIYNVAYDIWLNGVATAGCTEVMIWTENYNQVPAGSKAATRTFGSRTYDVFKTSNNGYIAFVPTAVLTSGSIDLLEIINWIISQGWLASTSTIGQICFGVEIVSTNNTNALFTFTDFSINTTAGTVGVTKKTPVSAVAKSPIVKNEYFSISGERLGPGAAGMSKNQIVINRMIDVNGVARSAIRVAR